MIDLIISTNESVYMEPQQSRKTSTSKVEQHRRRKNDGIKRMDRLRKHVNQPGTAEVGASHTAQHMRGVTRTFPVLGFEKPALYRVTHNA